MKPFAALAFSVLALSGCAITQEVTPSGLDQRAQELCLVRNSEVVQDGFHDVYVRVLEKKGFRVRTLPDKSPSASCPLVATYEAIYRWDMAIYLARVDLRIWADGREGRTCGIRLAFRRGQHEQVHSYRSQADGACRPALSEATGLPSQIRIVASSGLTSHSSRSRFAVRLNSGVSTHEKTSRGAPYCGNRVSRLPSRSTDP